MQFIIYKFGKKYDLGLVFRGDFVFCKIEL